MPSPTLIECVAKGGRDWFDFASLGLQSVIAGAAVYLAFRANRINRDTSFVGALVSELIAVRREAQLVRVAYVSLFAEFKTIPQKARHRQEWLAKRETLGERIAAMVDFFPETAEVLDRWGELDQVEDSHIFSDSIAANAAPAALKAYRRAFEEFADAASRCIQRERKA